MSEAAALIQVSGIKKVYKMSGNVRVNALNGVSFRVERGGLLPLWELPDPGNPRCCT